MKKIKRKYPSAKLDVSGIGYSKIRTVDGTEVNQIKGKLDITIQVRDKYNVSINLFVFKQYPYDLILGQNFLDSFDEIIKDQSEKEWETYN